MNNVNDNKYIIEVNETGPKEDAKKIRKKMIDKTGIYVKKILNARLSGKLGEA